MISSETFLINGRFTYSVFKLSNNLTRSQIYHGTELQVCLLQLVSLYICIFLTFKGIHGRPYRPWGGVQGDNPAGWQGYCTHSSILFAPWHRPYLALFEVGATLLVLLLNTHISTAIPVSNHTKDRCYIPRIHKDPISTSCVDFPYAILGLGCCTTRW